MYPEKLNPFSFFIMGSGHALHYSEKYRGGWPRSSIRKAGRRKDTCPGPDKGDVPFFQKKVEHGRDKLPLCLGE